MARVNPLNINAVKLVYTCKYHLGDQQNVVLINRWSLLCSVNSMESIHLRTLKYGLYKQVVFICRWYLEQV